MNLTGWTGVNEGGQYAMAVVLVGKGERTSARKEQE